MISLYAQLADLERRRLRSQVRLDCLKSGRDRNKLGQFATPPDLARECLALCLSFWETTRGRARFLDPAVGTGSFYSALREVFPEEMLESATGVEIDTAFAETARSLWGSVGLKVIHDDFTRLAPTPRDDQKFNLLICNPPYVRHHHLAQDQKQYLRHECAQRTGIALSGLAGLYCYFLLLSDAWLAPNAISLWLIPSEFMDVNYGASIKKYLCTQVALHRVHRFDPSEVQFDDALVSSAVVLFEKRKPEIGHVAEFTFGGSISKPRAIQRVRTSEISDAPKWTVFPLSDLLLGDTFRRPQMEHQPVLSDVFDIKRGIATGANEFFIMERRQAAERGLPAEYLKPVLPSPRYLKDRVIEADEEGFPRLRPSLVLLDCDLPEALVMKKHPRLWDYIAKGAQDGLPERYLLRGRKPWYSQEQRPPAPFLCTYMGRGQNGDSPFRFFLNQSRAVAANVYLLLYPIARLADVLTRDPGLASHIFSRLSALRPEELKTEGRVYGGGLHKIEPRELGRLSAISLFDSMPQLSEVVPLQPFLL